MKTRITYLCCLAALSTVCAAQSVRNLVLSVRDTGAVGDGTAEDTAAVQRAIDRAAEIGGGTVFVPAGNYMCGSLRLKSRVTLWLDNGATILGHPDDAAYDPYEDLGFENDSDRETSYFHHALLWGEEVEHVAIVGQGTIDGNRTKRGGPKPIALKRCRFVEIRGVHIVNAPNYCISMLGTDYVTIDGVTIRNAYCDGIDPDACQNVRIANCTIESWDDAIVPKASFSLGEVRATENITVTNCYLSTACNAFKLGTESRGDFKRIAVSNCVMTGLAGKRPAISGVSLESVDGSNIDGVTVSNLTMIDCRAPIFLRLGNRGRDMDTPVPGSLRNVSISNIVATHASLPCSIAGIPGYDIENVSISDVRITFAGGAPYHDAGLAIPEVEDAYPEASMFGAMPLYGFFVRHGRALTLQNIGLSVQPDFWRFPDASGKPQWDGDTLLPIGAVPGSPGIALVCDDVRELHVGTFRAEVAADGAPLLRFVNVEEAAISNCVSPKGVETYLQIAGERSGDITIMGSDLSSATRPIETIDGAPESAVRMGAQ